MRRSSISPILLACTFVLVLVVAGSVAASDGSTPEVGATVPDLVLAGLDQGQFTLSDRDEPTVLVFFRGVW